MLKIKITYDEMFWKSTRSAITNKYTGNENIIYKNDQGIPLKTFLISLFLKGLLFLIKRVTFKFQRVMIPVNVNR